MESKLFTILVLCYLAFGDALPMTTSFPEPFYRELELEDPPLQGKDVTILQNLLLRSPYVHKHLEKSSKFNQETSEALAEFQEGESLSSTGKLDSVTANAVLEELMYDGYHDDGTVLPGYKFKLLIPVYKDRTIETNATLLDSKNQPLYSFIVRCHGSTDSKTGQVLNQLTKNGNTPTGLMSFDLNSPEPNPKSFGQYPVVRAVKGIQGNAAIGENEDDTFLPDYRYGILLHTGEWENWNSSQPMPNSNGCIHAHPEDLKKVDEILMKSLNVTKRQNPFGKLPYPYEPQGLLSIQQMD